MTVGLIADELKMLGEIPCTQLLYKHWFIDPQGNFPEILDKESLTDISAQNPGALLHSQRVWLILSSVPEEYKNFVVTYFKKTGALTEEFSRDTSSVYLFDLDPRDSR